MHPARVARLRGPLRSAGCAVPGPASITPDAAGRTIDPFDAAVLPAPRPISAEEYAAGAVLSYTAVLTNPGAEPATGVVPGVLPVTNPAQTRRFAAATESETVRERMAEFLVELGDDEGAQAILNGSPLAPQDVVEDEEEVDQNARWVKILLGPTAGV